MKGRVLVDITVLSANFERYGFTGVVSKPSKIEELKVLHKVVNQTLKVGLIFLDGGKI